MEAEAGTGYFKKRYEADAITADMGNISVTVTKAENEGVAWGAVYWQYFEDLDKRSEEHTSELQSLMRISYAVFCLKQKTQTINVYRQVTQHIIRIPQQINL